MKILLIGYGKMGKAIDRLATQKGHEIVGKIDDTNPDLLQTIDTATVDVAIEFSRPDAAFHNISTCLKRGIKIISGTTGWLEKYEEIKSLCQANKGTFLYASNFSLGVNLFFALNKTLSKLMAGYGQYEPSLVEIHHTQKLDAPSGTAITLAESIIDNHPEKTKWVNEHSDKQDTITILSERTDQVPGTHTVSYDSEMDSIEIRHTAHTRDSFALGAVVVAEWINDKKGWLTMEDFINIKAAF
ncbi:MAG: 4-hydroxy-tetrahydrodipicolinate reductase [Cyclobacteriaceae bacterium]